VLNEIPRVSIEAVVIAFISAFVAFSTLAAQDPAESLAVIGLFGYASLRVMPALNKIVSSLNGMRFGRAALDDIDADLDLPMLPSASTGERLSFRDAIRLEHVEFQYEGTEQPTLHDIELTISRSESIGIVGSTGSGKSTMVDLIVGLSSPTTGTVTVDGVDLRGRAAAWQRNIGMVSQSVFLLDDTLRRNIALGLADAEIDEQQVVEAVRLAQLEDFVASLPDGLDTVVGERGARVSGGERQRVAIARALYPRPTVLVFDEGTSALDNLTEARLTEALAGLRVDHTIITVAHRLSTVQDNDRIVFVRDGRIHEVGGFDELVSRSEEFRRLARPMDAGRADQL
jgi:ATP-binding cassette subfamily C protein